MTNVCDIEKLVELFSFSAHANQLEDEEKPDGSSPPGNVSQNSANDIQRSSKANHAPSTTKKSNPYTKLDPPERKEVLDPENEDPDKLYFDQTEGEVVESKDWKNTPKWDISYRQSVTANDVFLGMGFKTPSTSSCENMIVTIDLPGEDRHNIDLKIEKDRLALTSPRFYLNLNLPHPVDPKRGNAQFDAQEDKLVVTLIMDRDLDLLNF